MRHPLKLAVFLCSFLLIISCQVREGSISLAKMVSEQTNGNFHDYWYQGVAEVNSYALLQSRYGEVREGDAILVFVTEDFSKSKQVKLDDSSKVPEDKISTLKLNSIRKFKTGIYDYSMMQSVFTPIDLKSFPNTLKTTASSQDWCGHSFTQLNLEDKQYRFSQNSYFEQEGDELREIENSILEDELFTRIRIDPSSIPTGNVELIPGLFYSRLLHENLKPKQARIRMEKKEAMNLIVEYLHFERTLVIRFEEEFHHRILSWTETNGKDWSAGGGSKATLKKTIRNAYWSKNKNVYESLRDTLQLGF